MPSTVKKTGTAQCPAKETGKKRVLPEQLDANWLSVRNHMPTALLHAVTFAVPTWCRVCAPIGLAKYARERRAHVEGQTAISDFVGGNWVC